MRRWIPWLLTLGALLELAGAVTPWIPHRAALRLTALDLFVVVRLLPPVRDRWSALPVKYSSSPRWLRRWCWAPRSAPGRAGRSATGPAGRGGPGADSSAPYPPILTAWRDPLYRGQLFLVLATCALALAGWLPSFWPFSACGPSSPRSTGPR